MAGGAVVRVLRGSTHNGRVGKSESCGVARGADLDIPGHDLPEQKRHNIQPLRFAANPTARFEMVNSSHHQALDRLGDGLEVEAWCATDGTIEQVRLRDFPFALGVQYHPERDSLYAPLFERFFDFVEQRVG